jgi:hypothetical protein
MQSGGKSSIKTGCAAGKDGKTTITGSLQCFCAAIKKYLKSSTLIVIAWVAHNLIHKRCEQLIEIDFMMVELTQEMC